MNKQRKYQKGITLIALVITIVVLLILAGVTLSIVFNGGIINKSQTAVDSYSEQSAREKLEIELINMLAEKVTNTKYNKDNFLTQKLFEAGFSVNGDIVIVDGWQFQIDRNVPKIINSLGKGTKNEEIKIELSQEVSDDYTTSTVTVQITYSGELKEININGEKINPIPDAVNGVYTITKEIKENKTVGVLVKDAEDNYNMGNIKVSALTEDMEIYTLEDMIAFRDKVNVGATFKGKTVMLMNDIDLHGSEENQWIPIGNYIDNNKLYFIGTFYGQGYKIKNLYINQTKDAQGLFGMNKGSINGIQINGDTKVSGAVAVGSISGINEGTIINCTNNIPIVGTTRVGGIVGRNSGIIEKCTNNNVVEGTGGIGGICGRNEKNVISCINYADIKGSSDSIGGISGNNFGVIEQCLNKRGKVTGSIQVGGINGYTTGSGTIYNCMNFATIISTGATQYSSSCTGGIVGLFQGSKLYNCYNVGNVQGKYRCIGGISGSADSNDNLKIYNVYNLGNITFNDQGATSNVASGTVGYILGDKLTGTISDYYFNTNYDVISLWNETDLKKYLGNEFTQDIKNEDGIWIYNNGYPILKWQLQN